MSATATPPVNLPAIAFDAVQKSFGRARILNAVSFNIPAGSTFGLAGVNGAGKTTLLKCLLDFWALDAGDVHIWGQSSRLPQARADLAFLPERFTPPYYLTGGDFLRYMLKLYGRPYANDEVAAMLVDLDLDRAILHKPVRTFSKGMTQKLGLAACFLSRRRLQILDEPMSGLDPRARALVKAQIAKLQAAGSTVFFTSHALADIEETCERMALLHQGEVRFTGTPAALRNSEGATSLEQAFLGCIADPISIKPVHAPHE